MMQQIRNKAGEIRVMFWWVDRSYRYLTGYLLHTDLLYRTREKGITLRHLL